MKTESFILAIDQGTSSCRSLLVNTHGQIVSMAQKAFKQYFPQAAWVEHDPEEIYSCQLETIQLLLKQTGVKPSQIISLGITNQRETTVLWQKSTGKHIHNAIVWQDRRTAGYCDQLKKEGFSDYIFERTGLVTDAYFSGTKVKWLLDNVESARDLAAGNDLCFGTIDTWLIWKLTEGESHLTDYTNASRTMLFDIRDLSWNTEILSKFEIPASILPDVQASASHFGVFDFDGTKIPITGVAGDQQSALFGQAGFTKGMAKNTYGTGCFLLMNIGEEFVNSKNGLLTTLCCDSEGKPTYALEGSVFIGGAAIQWLRDGLQIIKDSKETEQIALDNIDKNDVFMVPAFAGLGAPYWDSYARGAIFGLSRGTGKDEIIKATLDSLAYQSCDIIRAMEKDAGYSMEILKVDGGAAANNYLMQFQSDILQMPVERPKIIETTALGAALLSGIQMGVWDVEKIMENRKIDQQFNPKMNSERANTLYQRWTKAVKRTMNWEE